MTTPLPLRQKDSLPSNPREAAVASSPLLKRCRTCRQCKQPHVLTPKAEAEHTTFAAALDAATPISHQAGGSIGGKDDGQLYLPPHTLPALALAAGVRDWIRATIPPRSTTDAVPPLSPSSPSSPLHQTLRLSDISSHCPSFPPLNLTPVQYQALTLWNAHLPRLRSIRPLPPGKAVVDLDLLAGVFDGLFFGGLLGFWKESTCSSEVSSKSNMDLEDGSEDDGKGQSEAIMANEMEENPRIARVLWAHRPHNESAGVAAWCARDAGVLDAGAGQDGRTKEAAVVVVLYVTEARSLRSNLVDFDNGHGDSDGLLTTTATTAPSTTNPTLTNYPLTNNPNTVLASTNNNNNNTGPLLPRILLSQPLTNLLHELTHALLQCYACLCAHCLCHRTISASEGMSGHGPAWRMCVISNLV